MVVTLLSARAEPVMKVLDGILRLSCRLKAQLDADHRAWDNSDGFRQLARTHAKFRQCSAFLFRVATKLCEKGYQPYLEELLLRLDFNGFLTRCAREETGEAAT